MPTTTTPSTPRDWVDLAERSGDGLDVRLLWSPSTGRTRVTVTRAHSGRIGRLDVLPADALEAFYHPFAYRHPRQAKTRAAAPVGAYAGPVEPAGSGGPTRGR